VAADRQILEWVDFNKKSIELFYLLLHSPEMNPDDLLHRDLMPVWECDPVTGYAGTLRVVPPQLRGQMSMCVISRTGASRGIGYSQRKVNPQLCGRVNPDVRTSFGIWRRSAKIEISATLSS
jgi:hypothetical protein